MTDNSNLIQKLLKSERPDANENFGNLADFDPEKLDPKQLEALISQLYPSKEQNTSQNEKPNFRSFIPQPGFCLKTKTSNNEKIFLNICQSTEISAPKDISESQLDEIIAKQNDNDMVDTSFQFRVPMSLGEPHSELDNSASACVAYDVCINPSFFQKINKNAKFMAFFMTLVIDGLEAKYSLRLDRNCKMLTNKKFFGQLSEQFVRLKSKPIISEIEHGQSKMPNKGLETSSSDVDGKNKPFVSEIPKFKIFREPPEEDVNVQFLVAEIELPRLVSSKSVTLNIGEDRIVLSTRSDLYHLDIYLPYDLKQDECGAQFDKKTRLLTITMPVL